MIILGCGAIAGLVVSIILYGQGEKKIFFFLLEFFNIYFQIALLMLNGKFLAW
jgi:hypothetical protein